MAELSLDKIYGKTYSGKPEFSLGDGLSVRISPKGAISWQARMRLHDRPIRVPLGEYPLVDEQKARSALEVARVKIKKGEDPREVVNKKRGVKPPAVRRESGIEGFVYLAIDQNEESVIKVGASLDPAKRVGEVSRSYDRSFTLYALLASDDVYGLERAAHYALKEFHVERELYRLDRRKALSIIADLS